MTLGNVGPTLPRMGWDSPHTPFPLLYVVAARPPASATQACSHRRCEAERHGRGNRTSLELWPPDKEAGMKLLQELSGVVLLRSCQSPKLP